MKIATNHLRIKNGVLQQLWVFETRDAHLLECHDLTSPDAEIFRDEPNHTCGEWLEKSCTHEWRNVTTVKE